MQVKAQSLEYDCFVIFQLCDPVQIIQIIYFSLP